MNEILSSTDYDLFRVAIGNYTAREDKIQELMKSFSREYHICPIRVRPWGDKLLIYDGKHRFEAAKRLGLPVYYEIVEIY